MLARPPRDSPTAATLDIDSTQQAAPGVPRPALPFHGTPSPDFLASLRAKPDPRPASDETALLPKGALPDPHTTLPINWKQRSSKQEK